MMEPDGHREKERVHVLLGDVSPVADTPDSSLRHLGCGVFRSEQCPGRIKWSQFKHGTNMSYIDCNMSSRCWGQRERVDICFSHIIYTVLQDLMSDAHKKLGL